MLTGWDDRFDRRFGVPERYPDDRVSYFIPIRKGDETLAVLATGSNLSRKDEMLRRIDSMSSRLTQAAIALEHARLYQQVTTAHRELQAVIAGARCVIWHADLERRDGEIHWDIGPVDEDAAQRALPVDIGPGEAWEEAASRALRSGDRRYTQEFRGIDRHGVVGWVHEDVFVEPRGPGRWYLVGVLTDVTDRKQAERAKDEFVLTMSHEP